MDLQVKVGYEGANPQDGEGVVWEGKGRVRLLPESEDGDSNYKFALDATVHNAGPAVREVEVVVDWREPPEVGTRYMANRERLTVHSEGALPREVRGEAAGDCVTLRLSAPPGSTRLSLHPPYGRAELDAFFARAAALPNATTFCFGQTAEGRPMEAVVLRATERCKQSVLAIGRFHPYETAGSYCVSGVLDWLSRPPGEAQRRDRTFVLAPVANPDGVAHGLCKRTAWGGVDLSAEGNASSDPTACALRGLIAGVGSAASGALLLDAHGWMNREEGLWVCDRALGQRVVDQLQGGLYPHGWRLTTRDPDALDGPTRDLRLYAARQFGMVPVVTSIPWFGRTRETMRRIGAEIAQAALWAVAS